MSSDHECEICHLNPADVRVQLVEWLEPLDGRVWDTLARCRDRARCLQRLADAGEPWPLVDETHPRPEPPAVRRRRRPFELAR